MLIPNTIYALLVLLFLLVSLNLLLTMNLIKVIRRIKISNEEVAMPKSGSVINTFRAINLSDNSTFDLKALNAEAKVLVYLSSKCDKCREKIPELSNLICASSSHAVSIWVISSESAKQLNRFLNPPSVRDQTLIVDRTTMESLNPTGASPFYQFIDSENEIQASGFIGDDNWLTFREQLLSSKTAA